MMILFSSVERVSEKPETNSGFFVVREVVMEELGRRQCEKPISP